MHILQQNYIENNNLKTDARKYQPVSYTILSLEFISFPLPFRTTKLSSSTTFRTLLRLFSQSYENFLLFMKNETRKICESV